MLIGTSTPGKSTTLKMINRLVEHDSGVIRFAGEEIRSLPVLVPCRHGYAYSIYYLFPTGAWRKTSPPCRNYKNGHGRGSMIVSTN